jgi:hypothetical protein
MSKKRPKSGSTKQFDGLIRAIKTAKPLLTKPQLKVAESRFVANGWGVVRRSAMAVLSVPGTRLIQKISADRATAEAFVKLNIQIEQYVSFLHAQSELLKSASTRCILALCFREDFSELQAAAAQRARKRGRRKG